MDLLPCCFCGAMPKMTTREPGFDFELQPRYWCATKACDEYRNHWYYTLEGWNANNTPVRRLEEEAR